MGTWVCEFENGGCSRKAHRTQWCHQSQDLYDGKRVELVEEFVLGNVQHPILCAGRLLRRGWTIGGDNGQLALQHKEMDIKVPISDERHSLQFSARISMVETTAGKTEERAEARVWALQGSLSHYVKDLEVQPGWHQLPNGIPTAIQWQ